MTAADVIAEIKQLPPDAQAEVAQFAVELVSPQMVNIKPWEPGLLARALQNEQTDAGYPVDRLIQAQAFPND